MWLLVARMLSTGRAQGAVSPLGCLTGVFSHGQAVQGTGLSFIVYTEAIKNMAVSQLWSVLYFFMLLMLGIGSMLGNTAAILTPLTDSKVISSHLPKEAISGEWANLQRTWGSGRAGRGAGADGQAAAGTVCWWRWRPPSSPAVALAASRAVGTWHVCVSPAHLVLPHEAAPWPPQRRERPDSPTWRSELSRPGENLLLPLFPLPC